MDEEGHVHVSHKPGLGLNIEFEAPRSSLETTAYRTENGTIVTHLVNAIALDFGVRSPIGDVTVTSNKGKIRVAYLYTSKQELDIQDNKVRLPAIHAGEILVLDAKD